MAEEITISDLIAALEAASDLDREVIANILGVESFGAQQALTSTDQKQRINMRFLKDGAEVTTNSAGTTVGLTGGKGQFDIVNFTGGATAAIDSATNARQLNVSVGQGSGADCMFDFLVSECFATLTGFSEGQVFTSLSGCTFKGYSTVAGAAVQAAIDFATTTPAVVFVCSGVYEESVPIATGQAIQFTGAGREATYIGGLTGVSVGATFECAPGVTAVRLGLRSMTVESNDTTTGTASAGLRVPGDNSTVVCYDVHFIGAITNAAAAQYGADITEVSGDMPVFTNCTFSGNYGLYIHGSSPNAMITGCNFVDNTIAIRCGEDLVISGCHFRSCTTAISLIAASSDVNITGNHFVACTTGIASEGDYCSGILISSNTFNGLTTFVNFASLIGSSFNYGTVITNNRGSASTTLVALPAALERVQLEVNGNQNAGGSGTQAVYTGLRHPYMKFWDNSTDSDTGNQLEPIDGGHANLFTGNIWWLRQIPTPMAVGVTACVIRFGDTDVQVARQQQNLTPSIENFIEINSAGTLVVSTAWTPGTYHVLRVTCGISAGNATYTSHIDVGGILYVGAAASGGTGPAPNSGKFLTYSSDSTLTDNRVLTAGNGIATTDAGNNDGAFTIALGNLTAHWAQTGVFDIEHAGNLLVRKHAAFGSGASVSATQVATITETFINTGAASTSFIGHNGVVTKEIVTTPTSGLLRGIAYAVVIDDTGAAGAASQTGVVNALRLSLTLADSSTQGLSVSDVRMIESAAVTVPSNTTLTTLYHFKATAPTVGGTLTTQYGIYVPNMTGAGTNWAANLLGGDVYIQGGVQIGGAAAGSAAVAAHASAILDLNNVANLGLLIPPIATASRPTGTNGLLYYDTTTHRFVGYQNGGYKNFVMGELAFSSHLPSPVAADSIGIRVLVDGYTLSKVRVVLRGSSTPSVTYNLRYATDRSAAGTKVWTVDKTTTSTTTGDTFTTFDNAAITADAHLWLDIVSKSGTVDAIEITGEYKRT